MEEKLEAFRKEIGKLGGSGVGRRGFKYPAEVILRGAVYARAARWAKVPWTMVSKTMGIAVPTVQRWVEDAERAELREVTPTFQPVTVMSAAAGYTVEGPGGWRVTGLGLDAVVAVMKGLS